MRLELPERPPFGTAGDRTKAMRAYLLLIAMSAFAVCSAAPAHADCDAYNKRFLAYNELKAQVLHELERVNAKKPLPKIDVPLCRAALAVMQHGNVLAFNPEPSCFENKPQMDEFTGKIRSLSEESFKVAQLYCPAAEMRRPTKK